MSLSFCLSFLCGALGGARPLNPHNSRKANSTNSLRTANQPPTKRNAHSSAAFGGCCWCWPLGLPRGIGPLGVGSIHQSNSIRFLFCFIESISLIQFHKERAAQVELIDSFHNLFSASLIQSLLLCFGLSSSLGGAIGACRPHNPPQRRAHKAREISLITLLRENSSTSIQSSFD